MRDNADDGIANGGDHEDTEDTEDTEDIEEDTLVATAAADRQHAEGRQ